MKITTKKTPNYIEACRIKRKNDFNITNDILLLNLIVALWFKVDNSQIINEKHWEKCIKTIKSITTLHNSLTYANGWIHKKKHTQKHK